jgi:hypothetical protein
MYFSNRKCLTSSLAEQFFAGSGGIRISASSGNINR